MIKDKPSIPFWGTASLCLLLGIGSFEMASYAGECTNPGEQVWLTFASVFTGLASVSALIVVLTEIITGLDD